MEDRAVEFAHLVQRAAARRRRQQSKSSSQPACRGVKSAPAPPGGGPSNGTPGGGPSNGTYKDSHNHTGNDFASIPLQSLFWWQRTAESAHACGLSEHHHQHQHQQQQQQQQQQQHEQCYDSSSSSSSWDSKAGSMVATLVRSLAAVVEQQHLTQRTGHVVIAPS